MTNEVKPPLEGDSSKNSKDGIPSHGGVENKSQPRDMPSLSDEPEITAIPAVAVAPGPEGNSASSNASEAVSGNSEIKDKEVGVGGGGALNATNTSSQAGTSLDEEKNQASDSLQEALPEVKVPLETQPPEQTCSDVEPAEEPTETKMTSQANTTAESRPAPPKSITGNDSLLPLISTTNDSLTVPEENTIPAPKALVSNSTPISRGITSEIVEINATATTSSEGRNIEKESPDISIRFQQGLDIPTPTSLESSKEEFDYAVNRTQTANHSAIEHGNMTKGQVVARNPCLQLSLPYFKEERLSKVSEEGRKTGTSVGGPYDSMFKTLMNEITALTINQSIFDLYLVQLHGCLTQALTQSREEYEQEIKLLKAQVDELKIKSSTVISCDQRTESLHRIIHDLSWRACWGAGLAFVLSVLTFLLVICSKGPKIRGSVSWYSMTPYSDGEH